MSWWRKKLVTKSLLESVQDNEGMSSIPYIDVLVAKAPEQHGIPPNEMEIIKKHLSKLKLTFGMGLTFITTNEALKVTEMRLEAIKKEVSKEYPHIKNREVLDILTEMAYQMGMNGLRGFKRMHKDIKDNDLIGASMEGINSKWYRQTPNRAKKLMDKMAMVKSIYRA